MARRITRAESVGLEAPGIEQLREALATFREGLAETQQQIEAFLAAGGGFYVPSEGPGITPLTDLVARGSVHSFGDLVGGQRYYEEALREVGIDLAWTLALNGRSSEADQVQQIFEAELERIGQQRGSSIEHGWRYREEEQVLADRESFWESAQVELSRWLVEGERERTRVRRGGIGARLGRALRRLVVWQ